MYALPDSKTLTAHTGPPPPTASMPPEVAGLRARIAELEANYANLELQREAEIGEMHRQLTVTEGALQEILGEDVARAPIAWDTPPGHEVR